MILFTLEAMMPLRRLRSIRLLLGGDAPLRWLLGSVVNDQSVLGALAVPSTLPAMSADVNPYAASRKEHMPASWAGS